MPLGSGLSAQLGFATESVFGSPVAASRFYEFNSESMQLKRQVKQGTGLRAGGRFPESARRAVTARDASGDFEIDLPYVGCGILLKHMLGSATSAATQQGASAAYQQVHTDGTLNGKSFTMQKGVPSTDGTVDAFTYPGCKFDTWELTAQQNEIVTLKGTVDAIDELPAGAGPRALQTASFPNTAAFTFLQGSLLAGGTVATAAGLTTVSGGTAIAQVRQVSLKGDHKLKTDRWFLGGAGVKGEQLENDFADYNGQLQCEFSSMALYNAYLAEQNVALQLLFTGPIIASTFAYLLEIIVPAIRYEDNVSPQVGGPDVVMQTVPFTVFDDSSGTNPRIQMRYVSTDTAL